MFALNYAHLSANGSSNLMLAPCTLHTVTINTKGATANTLTLTDGANGPTIAVIDTTTQVQTLVFDVQCQNGLTAVLANGTAADVTISFG